MATLHSERSWTRSQLDLHRRGVYARSGLLCPNGIVTIATHFDVNRLLFVCFTSQELDQVSADIASKYILKLVDDDALAVATVRTMQS